MAGEIAHVVYAARVLTTLGERVSHSSYWTGTVFPDIYRIHVAGRYPTHPRPVSLATIIGTNDFRTGMRVHAWIDETRSKYMHEVRAYERLPWHPLLPYALELLEDELLYDAYDDWDAVCRSLEHTHPDEVTIIHEQAQLHTWHTALTNYFQDAPSDISRAAFAKDTGIPESTAHDTNTLLHTLRASSTSQELLHGYIGELEQMLK